MLVLSSLGSVIVHIIQDELLYGSGVPLGLLGSDSACGSLRYVIISILNSCNIPYPRAMLTVVV